MPGAARSPSKWTVAIFALLALAVGLMILHDAVSEAPALGALHRSRVVLRAPVELVRPATRSSSGPYAEIRWDGSHVRVRYLCFLSDCRLPPALAAAHAGDELGVWTDGDIAWQVASGGGTLLAYQATASAFDRAMRRRVVTLLPVWLITVALAAGALWLRRARMPREQAAG